MAYRITTTDSHKIVLERESTTLATGLFIGIGALFFLIGVGLNVFMTTWEMPYIVFRILFPVFGLLAIYAGAYLPKQAREMQPEQIIFDHDKGAVVVDMAKAGDQRGYIPYSEISGYDIFVESRNSSSRNSSTTYYYHVFLKKKDGGEWFLFNFSDRTQAEAMIALLVAQVPVNKPFLSSGPQVLSPKIEKKEGLDKTVIHWQNKVSLAQPIFLAVFSIIFLGVLYSFFSFATQLGIFGFIVLGFIFLVFLIVIGVTVRKLIKDATTRYAVSVDHASLEYYEFSKSSGQMRNKKALPIQDVHSISYNYAPSNNYQQAGLKIMTLKEAERAQQDKEKPIEALKNLFSRGNQPITLSITALNPVECLQLENWLQELIFKKADKAVL